MKQFFTITEQQKRHLFLDYGEIIAYPFSVLLGRFADLTYFFQLKLSKPSVIFLIQCCFIAIIFETIFYEKLKISKHSVSDEFVLDDSQRYCLQVNHFLHLFEHEKFSLELCKAKLIEHGFSIRLKINRPTTSQTASTI